MPFELFNNAINFIFLGEETEEVTLLRLRIPMKKNGLNSVLSLLTSNQHRTLSHNGFCKVRRFFFFVALEMECNIVKIIERERRREQIRDRGSAARFAAQN